MKEVKHITPIEEAVALAAIKKFRLTNQLEPADPRRKKRTRTMSSRDWRSRKR